MSFADKLKARLAQMEEAAKNLLPNVAPEELASSRLDICKACPYYISLTHQCKKCGCVMNLKVKLEGAKCPIGKW